MKIYYRLLLIVILCAGTIAGAKAADVSGEAQIGGKKAANEAIVYLEGDHKGMPLGKAVVDQREKMFIPHISVVTRGTTVQFPNNDTVFHNVFAYFQAKKFDLGMYPRGTSKTVTFDKAGLVSLQCNVHSEMSAYILVVDTPYYAIADRQGKFRIHNVAPGTYTLRGWHESGAVASQTITVGASDSVAKLSLARK